MREDGCRVFPDLPVLALPSTWHPGGTVKPRGRGEPVPCDCLISTLQALISPFSCGV